MKKLLPLLVLILIGCSEPEPIDYEMLVERDGLYYKKNTNEVYSGPVFNINGQTSEGYIKKGKEHGKFEFYYSNGQLQLEGTWKDGKSDGLWKGYYENGQLEVERTYKDGKENGLYKSYYDNGQLKEERTYKDGELIESKEYHNQITNNWMELKVWMTKEEVREIIGDPLSVRVSENLGDETWYYENGQYVTFGYYGGVLTDWYGETQ